MLLLTIGLLSKHGIPIYELFDSFKLSFKVSYEV